MELGLVGKPNVGKSTFFSAATLAQAGIGNYPFTTRDPNRGVAYVRMKCPCGEYGLECDPNNSNCINGTRFIPVEIIDVAGLVPDAHRGRGLGNQFLDDLSQANALIHIVDASGSTSDEGDVVPVGSHDPAKDIEFLDKEITHWIKNLLFEDWKRISRKVNLSHAKLETVVGEKLTGLGIKESHIHSAMREASLSETMKNWTEEDLLNLSSTLRRISKPIIIAANKSDLMEENEIEELRTRAKLSNMVPISADYELALRRAADHGLIEYMPGEDDFKIINKSKMSQPQVKGLEKIRDFMKTHGSLGVQKTIENAVYDILELIVVYPVEDENHLTDKNGNVLPDAYLMPKDSTVKEMAYKVHTDLGDNFIRAMDVRTKRYVGADHKLKNNDIIKIISNK